MPASPSPPPVARVVVVRAGRALPPGHLPAATWDLLRAVPVVVTAGHRQLSALRASGVTVEVVEGGLAEAAARVASLLGEGGRLVWFAGDEPGTPAGESVPPEVGALAALGVTDVEVVGGQEPPGARLLDLVAVMDRLRSPGGCPWDAEQTHRSLVTYLIEETYEVIEAIETGDLDDLAEELGDLLLQVVFHARVAEEHAHPFTIDDVAAGIAAKLVRRHPHVFGEVSVAGSGEVELNWDRLKAAEKNRASAMDGVPFGQPALSLASKLVDRARRAGLATAAVADPPREGDDPEHRFGEALLDLVVAARGAGVDPEAALRAAARRLAERVRAAQRERAES